MLRHTRGVKTLPKVRVQTQSGPRDLTTCIWLNLFQPITEGSCIDGLPLASPPSSLASELRTALWTPSGGFLTTCEQPQFFPSHPSCNPPISLLVLPSKIDSSFSFWEGAASTAPILLQITISSPPPNLLTGLLKSPPPPSKSIPHTSVKVTFSECEILQCYFPACAPAWLTSTLRRISWARRANTILRKENKAGSITLQTILHSYSNKNSMVLA